jgi:hypothetical protein
MDVSDTSQESRSTAIRGPAGVASAERRWAGAFRVCPSCGGRNWIGARRCRTCQGLMAGVRAAGRQPVAMVGRRTSDRVFTPRLRMAAVAAGVMAILAGVVTYRILRTESFVAAAAPASVAEPAPPLEGIVSEGPGMAEPVPDRRSLAAGRRALDRGDVKRATALLAEAARTLPYDAEAAHLYGRALLLFGAADRAVFQLRRAVRLAPRTGEYRADLARALRATGREAEAAHVLQAGNGLEIAGHAFGDSTAGLPSTLPASDEGVSLGGAGRGTFKGRRSFTDADLARGSAAPGPEPGPSPAPSASPEGRE